MAKIYGQLEKAQLENVGADPSAGYPGRVFFNTVTKKFKGDDGVIVKDLGGGGGGASLQWNTDNGTPFIVDNGGLVFLFASLADLDGAQVNKAFFKVPESYTPGGQINLYIMRYTPDIAGTVLLAANTYLIRTGLDPMDDSSNVYASGNTATAVPGTAKIPQKITIPLTSSTGTINSVAVNPGDILRIELQRGTDTATSEVRVFTSTEVTLS